MGVMAYVSTGVISIGANVSLVQRSSVKAVGSRKSKRLLLSRVVLLPLLAKATLTSVVLEIGSLLMRLHNLTIHLPIESSTSNLARLIVL